jgi:hypothetical protein
MMMSKHETALALVEEQIEKEEHAFYDADAKVNAAEAALARAEKERKLIQWSLDELRKSRSALLFDRSANSVTPEPSEVP